MLDYIVQAVMVLTGASAIALLAFERKKVSRWGWLCGTLGAPFWLYATWPFGGEWDNWGIFALSVWYTGHYVKGLWTFLLKRRST